MPIHLISVAFFFTVDLFDDHAQSNQLNTRDRKRKKRLQQEQILLFKALFFSRVCF